MYQSRFLLEKFKKFVLRNGCFKIVLSCSADTSSVSINGYGLMRTSPLPMRKCLVLYLKLNFYIPSMSIKYVSLDLAINFPLDLLVLRFDEYLRSFSLFGALAVINQVVVCTIVE